MKLALLLLSLLIFTSCIPLRIAPSIKEDKIMLAKKFKRTLPKKHSFIFEDPKDADEFYNFINTKYNLDHENVEYNVPFIIDDNEYFLSFHEVEIPTKTINLVPIFIDTGLKTKGYSPVLSEHQFSRIGNWYIVLTVADSKMIDCLDPKFANREEIIGFLKKTRMEYLTTSNYMDALFRK